MKLITDLEKYTPINQYPHLHVEWHTKRNQFVLKKDFKLTSNSKVWWVCKKDHTFSATISNRKMGKGCPYCAGKKVCLDNCLATVNPGLASEWHPTKNGDFTPYDIMAGSNKRVWWMCPKGHEYEAVVNSRNRGSGCKICGNKRKGKRAVRDNNRLSLLYPNLANEWHPTKNEQLLPSDVSYGSDKVVWWMCNRGHEYKSPISQRTRGNGCAKCNAGLHTSFAEQAINYYLSVEVPVINNYKPEALNGMEIDVYIPSLKVAIEYNGWFFHSSLDRQNVDVLKEDKLKVLGITLIKIIELRNDEQLFLKQKIDDNQYIHKYRSHYSQEYFNSLDYCIKMIFKSLSNFNCGLDNVDIDSKRDRLIIFEKMQLRSVKKSLAAKRPDLLTEWNFKRNEKILPEFVSYGSGIKVWWTCSEGHDYEMPVAKRTSRNSQCPICNGSIVTDDTSLYTLFPEIAEEWHEEKNSIAVNRVRPGSNMKVWWKCKKGHEWEAVISSRTSKNTKCPYCRGRLATPETCLQTTHPHVAANWDYSRNGDITPNDVLRGAGKKCWWKCPKGHIRYRSIRDEVKSVIKCSKCKKSKKH
ncbi:zinc-ribbon domain-containing protein [Bacillus proteolyticus]|uniref:zinc-ribbon domain-containing protein n=1 Tax=Bacillus proteolyticus TaxID=2026192 RepID=UPI0030F45B51